MKRWLHAGRQTHKTQAVPPSVSLLRSATAEAATAGEPEKGEGPDRRVTLE